MTLHSGEVLGRRVAPVDHLRAHAELLTAAARDMADRFAAGGRLLVLGSATDAQHVAVEFLHPVIVGKRALPALSLVADVATLTELARTDPTAVFAAQLEVLSRPQDIALAITRSTPDSALLEGLQAAHERGLLTVALAAAPVAADHVVVVPSDDPGVVKEGHVSAYHLLWELVHVFLDPPAAVVDDDPALALYPFLSGSSHTGLETSATTSSRDKLTDVAQLRAALDGAEIDRCADRLAEAFAAGATLIAFGNGGSSTDTQDVVQTFLAPSRGRALPALCLTNDVAVLTALANDVGFDVVFARQLRALARPGDIAFAVSTSGGSGNVLAGLRTARELGLVTVGLAGYDGGAMRDQGMVDHLFVVPSSSVHRIQEVQTTLYHVLWEAVQDRLSQGAAGQ
ncbi:MAG: SIS domain-containing protein [Mycobacteriales bacterium]